MRVTVVCIWQKRQQFDEFRKNLFAQKNIDINLVAIDNSSNQHSSIRKILNEQADLVETDYVVFCHPDIVFLNDSVMIEMFNDVLQLDDFGVIGVAGCEAGKHWDILSNIVHGDNKIHAGTTIDGIQNVQTVDECLFIVKKEFIKTHKFSNYIRYFLKLFGVLHQYFFIFICIFTN